MNLITSVSKLYLVVSYHVSYFDWFLERGIFLPAVQLFMISVEEVFWKSVDNQTGLDHDFMIKTNTNSQKIRKHKK